MKWINTKHQLPESSSKVLVYTTDHSSCHIGIYLPKHKQWQMYYYDGLSNINDREITHWMPLPEPPKS